MYSYATELIEDDIKCPYSRLLSLQTPVHNFYHKALGKIEDVKGWTLIIDDLIGGGSGRTVDVGGIPPL